VLGDRQAVAGERHVLDGFAKPEAPAFTEVAAELAMTELPWPDSFDGASGLL